MAHAGLEATGVQAPVAPGRLPLLGHAVSLWREPIAFLESLRDHGEVVRLDIGTWPVHLLTSPELVHEVLVARAERFGRGRIFDRLKPVFGNGIVTTDGAFHRNQRRMIQPAFHRNHIARARLAEARQALDALEGALSGAAAPPAAVRSGPPSPAGAPAQAELAAAAGRPPA
ncbi:cytochrome P450 [Streptomyces sp. WAC05292]|uniref:cytochrome P450 n=1 Tax=Streptomyces sp. WAC05292 TaxID=2487418 RepID=UPI0021B06E4C|nr:cytochrome P450 [Streptomyces sp. WAC05292]